jgi:hypothetical protein
MLWGQGPPPCPFYPGQSEGRKVCRKRLSIHTAQFCANAAKRRQPHSLVPIAKIAIVGTVCLTIGVRPHTCKEYMMARSSTRSPVVQNGKIIPPEIITFMERFTAWLDPENDTPKTHAEREQIFSASFEDVLDLQSAVTEEDFYKHLKAVAVSAIQVMADVKEDTTLTLKEMTELQVGIMHTLDEARGYTTTLVIHRVANWWGVPIPRDLRIDGKAELYSEAFEDAE